MSDSGLSPEDDFELWKLDRFVRAGFDGDACAALLAWRVSPSDADKLVRGGCPLDLALSILKPLETTTTVVDTPELAERLAGYSLKV